MHTIPTQRVRRPGRITALALACLLAIGAAAHAAPSPQPTFDAKDPEDAKLQKVFQRFDAKRDVVEGSLRSLELQLIEVETRLAKLRAQLAKAEAELAKRRAELAAAKAKLDAQRALLHDSAAEIYMRGPWSYLNAMLNAEDINSLSRVDVYSKSVLNDFISILREFEALKARVEKLYQAIRAKTIDLRKQAHDVEKEETKILQRQSSVMGQRQRLINSLVDDFGGLDELKKHGFDIIIRAETGTSTRITQLLQEAQKDVKKEDVAETGEYVLRWPLEEHRITSRFGWRIHPLWGYRSYHTGIDLGANYGDKVFAAADGVVLDVAYMGPYGLAIVLDNGHAIGTVYAHLSRTRVAAGQTVKAGDEIGRVGCSGWCTGPHVHFEVRVMAKPENPVFWL
ncbi:MAG: peptidoglycan DD-metalloendopeptidase family protein [Actinomycetota bacterium]